MELIAETGFNSSQKTKGTLFTAKKPAMLKRRSPDTTGEDRLEKYQAFLDAVYAEGALDRKTKHLIALGATLAAGCEQGTQYCLAAARQLGTTDEELEEAMVLAMAVAGTKIRILQESTLASLPKEEGNSPVKKEKDAFSPEEACAT